jgi:hypothetical protein
MPSNDDPRVFGFGDNVALTAMWNGSRWASWTASMPCYCLDRRDVDVSDLTLAGILVLERPGPVAALDAFVAGARFLAIDLTYRQPTLSLHSYSVDGETVRYPGGAALIRAQAARLGWCPGRITPRRHRRRV